MIAFAAAITVVGRVTVASGLHFNVTPSMPIGIYRLAPVRKSGVQRGTFVAVCAPIDAARLGLRRGYLADGRCAADTEPLLKVVAAVAGDEVTISSRGVAVNGCLLPHSRPLESTQPVALSRPGHRDCTGYDAANFGSMLETIEAGTLAIGVACR